MTDLGEFWQALSDHLPTNFAADVFKTLIGTFIGAGLAFWFAIRKENMTRAREQRAAGNAAVTALLRMASDFAQVRLAIQDHRERVLAEQPTLPIWMQVLPMPFKHSENLH